MTHRDGDLRMLGTRDGLAHALIWVRGQIDSINGRYAPRIHPRHTHKQAARDAKLRPLMELEERIAKAHQNAQAAYDRSRSRGEKACTCGQAGHGNGHEIGCPMSDYRPAQSDRQAADSTRGEDGKR